MGGLEDRRLFHAQRRQLVDVEEAAIVDVVGRHAPRREAKDLRREQFVQRIEARRIARATVELLHLLFDATYDLGRASAKAGETLRVQRRKALPFRDARRRRLGRLRQHPESHGEAVELVGQRRFRFSKARAQALLGRREDARIRLRVERKAITSVTYAELALGGVEG